MGCSSYRHAILGSAMFAAILLLAASTVAAAKDLAPANAEEDQDRNTTSLAWQKPSDSPLSSKQPIPSATLEQRVSEPSDGMAGVAVASCPPACCPSCSVQPNYPEPNCDGCGFLRRDTPKMFGGQLFSAGNLVADDGLIAATDLPLGGGAGRLNIADNNSPFTDDRVYFCYNHFANALTADASNFRALPDRHTIALDRYTVGFEKTFFDRLWSVEMRLPLTNSLEMDTPNFSVAGGNVGNLAVIAKRMIYQTDNTAVAAGLGIDVPTGSDVMGEVNGFYYRVRDQAVHLSPYVGMIQTPNDRVFYQGFIQVDVPLNGNQVDYVGVYSLPLETIGTLREQTLMHVDLQGGYWFYRNRCDPWVTGIASVIELHYLTTLNGAPELQSQDMQVLTFGNSANRVNLVDMTIGLHAEIAQNTVCRIAAVFPLQSDNREQVIESVSGRSMSVRVTGDRTFDSEIVMQVERRF